VSLDFSLKNSKVVATATSKISALIRMPKPTDTQLLPPMELDAQYQYSATFNEQSKAYEITSPIKITGKDAGLVQALMAANPATPEKTQSIIDLSAIIQSLQTDNTANNTARINCEAFKSELQEWIGEYAKNPTETKYVYGLSDMLKDIESRYFDPNKNLLGGFEAEARQVLDQFNASIRALSPVGKAELILKEAATANPKVQSQKRHEAAALLVQELKQASPAVVEKTMQEYHAALDSGLKSMVSPSGPSRYTATVNGEEKSATASHGHVLKAAKRQIEAASKKGAVLSKPQKALLAVERKKPWASRKFWIGIGMAVGAGALIGFTGGLFLAAVAPVVVASIVLPVVAASLLGAAATALGYFGYKTPKKVAEMAYVSSKTAKLSKALERTVEPPALSPAAAIEVAEPVAPAAASAVEAHAQPENRGLPRTASAASVLPVFDATHSKGPQEHDPKSSPQP
jgi:hypothetical protein